MNKFLNLNKFHKRLTFPISWVLLFSLFILGCDKPVSTPENSFKSFSKWVSLGQPDGMKKYGEKDYVDQLQASFDSLLLLSELWPKDPLIISSNVNNDEATLKVEGKNALGKDVIGTFTLKRQGDQWMVHSGDWQNLFGQETGQ
jgi:hypothetical protein